MNNKTTIKKILYIPLFTLLLFISNTIQAQHNFKLSGTFTDVKNGTLIYEYIVRGKEQEVVTKETPIKEGKFTLFAQLDEACAATLQIKDRHLSILSTLFVPNEEAVVHGAISKDYSLTWNGTTFYQQYGKAKTFMKEYEEEFAQADRTMYKDTVLISNKKELRKINCRHFVFLYVFSLMGASRPLAPRCFQV